MISNLNIKMHSTGTSEVAYHANPGLAPEAQSVDWRPATALPRRLPNSLVQLRVVAQVSRPLHPHGRSGSCGHLRSKPTDGRRLLKLLSKTNQSLKKIKTMLSHSNQIDKNQKYDNMGTCTWSSLLDASLTSLPCSTLHLILPVIYNENFSSGNCCEQFTVVQL